jgi:hypothetical protein
MCKHAQPGGRSHESAVITGCHMWCHATRQLSSLALIGLRPPWAGMQHESSVGQVSEQHKLPTGARCLSVWLSVSCCGSGSMPTQLCGRVCVIADNGGSRHSSHVLDMPVLASGRHHQSPVVSSACVHYPNSRGLLVGADSGLKRRPALVCYHVARCAVTPPTYSCPGGGAGALQHICNTTVYVGKTPFKQQHTTAQHSCIPVQTDTSVTQRQSLCVTSTCSA